MIRKQNLTRKLIFSLAFLIILFLISYCLLLIIQKFQTNAIQEILQTNYEELNDITAKIHYVSDPVIHYNEVFEKFIRCLITKGFVTQHIKKIPPSTKLYLFDQNGKRIVRSIFSKELIVSSEKFIKVLEKISNERFPSISKLDKKLLESFCGSTEAAIKISKVKNCLIDLAPYGINKLIGWYKFSRKKNYTLFVIIDKSSFDEDKIFLRAIYEIQQKLDKLSSFYLIGYSKINDKYKCYNAYSVELSNKWQKLFSKRYLPTNFNHKNLLFSVQQIGGKFLVFVCKRIKLDSKKINILLSSKYFVAFVTFVISLLIVLNLLFNYTETISIKFQLIFCFAIIGFISIGGLIALTYVYYQNKQNEIIEELTQEAEVVLRRVDEEFLPSFDKYLLDYRMVLASGSINYRFDLLNKYFEEGFIEAVYAINKNEQTIFKLPNFKLDNTSHNKEEVYVFQIFPVLHRLASQIIKRIGQQKYDKKEIEVKTSSDMLNILLERPIDGIIQHRSRLQNLKIGILEKYAFVDYEINKQNEVETCLIILHDRTSLQNLYLNSVYNFFNKNKKDLIFLAIPVNKDDQYLELFPKYFKSTNEVQHLINKAIKTNALTTRNINIYDSEYLFIATPAKNIKNYILILATNLEPTKVYIQRTSNFYNSIFLAIFIFTVLLGIQYGNTLIRPVVQLTRWLQEIQNMNFSVKMQISTNDELSEIGEVLNEIVEEKKEIELAKIVQDSLLPNSPLTVSNIKIYGSTVSSSELISEIYDYLLILDRYIIFFIISSNAKGISSALLCAMCKMALHIYIEIDKLLEPSKILHNLYLYLQSIIRREVNVSVLLGLIDTYESSINISFAGKWFILNYSSINGSYKDYELNGKELCANFSTTFENLNIKLLNETINYEYLLILSPKIYKIACEQNYVRPRNLLLPFIFELLHEEKVSEKVIITNKLSSFVEKFRKFNFEKNIVEDISMLIIEKIANKS